MTKATNIATYLIMGTQNQLLWSTVSEENNKKCLGSEYVIHIITAL